MKTQLMASVIEREVCEACPDVKSAHWVEPVSTCGYLVGERRGAAFSVPVTHDSMFVRMRPWNETEVAKYLIELIKSEG